VATLPEPPTATDLQLASLCENNCISRTMSGEDPDDARAWTMESMRQDIAAARKALQKVEFFSLQH